MRTIPAKTILVLNPSWRQDEQGRKIEAVFETDQHLMEAPAEETEKRRIGFPTNQTPAGIANPSDAEEETR